jgi:NADP-dependent 3-hydroxy acid dehydrogenase YdfG
VRAEVVVITGASAGVGRAAARKFARHGARIGLLARGNDGLEATRREVEDLGSDALVVTADVANADQVESAAARIEAEFGQIDIWINNAMTSVFSPIKQMTAAEYWAPGLKRAVEASRGKARTWTRFSTRRKRNRPPIFHEM